MFFNIPRALILLFRISAGGYDSATKILSGVIICPGIRWDSGYVANSFAGVRVLPRDSPSQPNAF